MSSNNYKPHNIEVEISEYDYQRLCMFVPPSDRWCKRDLSDRGVNNIMVPIATSGYNIIFKVKSEERRF